MLTLTAAIERFELAQPFVIARGAKSHVDVVTVTVTDGRTVGRGEGTPVYYRGDSAEAALAALQALSVVPDRVALLDALPAGAARNALDAALWDFDARQSGRRVWEMLRLPPPQPMLTAYTISTAAPGAMAEQAAGVAGRELLKVKVSGEDPVAQVAAVHRAAPAARLIVDANESWGALDIERTAHALAALGVELIEQPLPAGADADLRHVSSPVPLCADESVHDRASLDAVVGRYRFINVKLDKAGGLTEALALAAGARARGLGLMTGCMLGTSLGIAPAFYVAMQGLYADLDAPLLLARDRENGLAFTGSDVRPPTSALWGG